MFAFLPLCGFSVVIRMLLNRRTRKMLTSNNNNILSQRAYPAQQMHPPSLPSQPQQRRTSNPRQVSSRLTPSTPVTPNPTPPGPLSTSAPDLQGRPNVPSTPPSQRARARDLLRKHYGLGLGPPSSSGNPADPLNMGKGIFLCYKRNVSQRVCWPDSPAFDAKSYYEQLITTSSLPTLIKRENELITGIAMFHAFPPLDLRKRSSDTRISMAEIRELDSERQSLVYNHHHELIAASDTIAAVGLFFVFSTEPISHDTKTSIRLDEDSSGEPGFRPRPSQGSILRDISSSD